jgi:hypothetical protein
LRFIAAAPVSRAAFIAEELSPFNPTSSRRLIVVASSSQLLLRFMEQTSTGPFSRSASFVMAQIFQRAAVALPFQQLEPSDLALAIRCAKSGRA